MKHDEIAWLGADELTKAYRDLELLQLVHTRRGVGVTVSDKAPKISKESTRMLVRNHLRDAVAECIAAGLPASEVKTLVQETMDSGATPYETKRKR